jgi:putative membrane protein
MRNPMTMKRKILALGVIIICVSFFPVFSNSTDKFFDQAIQFHLTVIQAGKLAVIKGNPKVIQLGKELVKDNTIAKNELYALAQKHRLKIATGSGVSQKKTLAGLRELSGKAFDSAFMISQFNHYQQAIAFFSEESKTGMDPEARAYAGKYLPKLQMHLQMFQGNQAAIKTTMDSTGNN